MEKSNIFIEDANTLTVYKAALMLDVAANTLARWYGWYNDPNYKKPDGLYLPPLIKVRAANGRVSKGILATDFNDLLEFQAALKRGHMAEYNARYTWGKYGTDKLNRPKDWKRKNAKKEAKGE